MQQIQEVLPESTSISVNISDAYERGKVDINFFAALCLPSVCIFQLPIFYIAIWQLLVFRKPEDLGKLLRFALGLPRGHAKTTFIKILIVWLIVYDKASFILIVCSNGDLAENLLADIHDILSSPNLTAVYGNWEDGLAIDASDTKKGTYHTRTVTLVARGWSSGIRGLNLQNDRPDVIFCDDVQTRQNDESPTESIKLLKELTGTIFKALTPRGNRLIIYVGNMYSENCILKKFQNNRSWFSMVTGAILSTGLPLWPELFSLEELMESYYHDEELGLSDIWFAEVMNDPKSARRSLLHDQLPSAPHGLTTEELLEQHDGACITIDPAGFRKISDDNVAACHVKYENTFNTVETLMGIMDPAELIKNTLIMALKWRVSVIGVESVGYQQTLGFWITFFMRELHIDGILVVELSPHGRSKETRIRQDVMDSYAGNSFIVDPETRRKYVWQASLYKIGEKENKDDLLDAIAYRQDMRNEYWALITPPLKDINPFPKLGVMAYNTPF